MAKKHVVKFTANFERNLEAVEAFMIAAQAPQAFDALLSELADAVIPNLERFPDMGRPFLNRAVRSVETSNGVDALKRKHKSMGKEGALHEYVLSHYLLLYARFDTTLYCLSIKHHRQLSFDFESHWNQSTGN